MFGTQEWLIIAVIGLVMFNWRKLPQMGSTFGQALTNFKRGLNEPEEVDAGEKKDTGEIDKKDSGEIDKKDSGESEKKDTGESEKKDSGETPPKP